MNPISKNCTYLVALLCLLNACSKDDDALTLNLGISPVSDADAGSSYEYSKTDIHVDYINVLAGRATSANGNLLDAVAYLDANGDEHTDVFFATGEFLSMDEFDCILAVNDGTQNFDLTTAPFNNNMPKATHARKSIVSDFNNDNLLDILVLDTGFDAYPYPGSHPKLIIQNSVGSFSWSRLQDQTGFHHGGAAADIDNDGDIDVFIGGDDPFFFINDGQANFTLTKERLDKKLTRVFTAELIDVDKDGFVDLLVGAHEFEEGGGVDHTSIYWGNSTGTFHSGDLTIITPFPDYGTVLDFEAEDLDGDGDRDLVVNRTGGGGGGTNNNFYIGRKIQLLFNDGDRNFQDVTSRIDNPGTASDSWITWLRAQDRDNDGDIDIFPDNANNDFTLVNDGSGNFKKM